ncbi:MAG TPA: peptide deformylase [Brevefilum sp.]|nr:peptide deformylase [Brevefilum sp.]HOR19131.1 peptide deformylase [Brevefilum sp.]HPL69649.1 peptide deformylase [Brevefilum sp.]
MAIRKIYPYQEAVVRQKAQPVEVFDEDLQTLIDDMIETMREAPGVGLAAPQIGVSKQLIVVEFGNEDDEAIPEQLFVLANPEIVQQSEEQVSGIEGCLSVPGFVGEVARSQVVTVRGQDRQGKNLKIRAQGWLARIFQHEIDHLNGVLYTDRAEQIWQPDQDEMETI